MAWNLRRWNVYDHKHTTTMQQSLRLIYMGQCLCTDPHSQPLVMLTASNVQLMQRIPNFKPPEAPTEHTSPFGQRTKKNTPGFESTQRRNCVQLVHKASRTDAEHVFTVEPSIAPQQKQHLQKNPRTVLRKQYPDTKNKTARYETTTKKSAKFPSVNCASEKCRKFTEKPL